MSMQPEARRPGTKDAILAQPKHGMARWSAVSGCPSRIEQAMPEPLLRHAGWHGMARHLQIGLLVAW